MHIITCRKGKEGFEESHLLGQLTTTFIYVNIAN